MDKSNDASMTIGIVSERVLALSWNIATEPRLYRELAPNPYGPLALQVISERFPNVNTADVIKAVVLAEPEGKYDRNFGVLSKDRQAEELLKQQSTIAEVNKRLALYFKKHAKDLSRLPKVSIYKSLSELVFGPSDIKEIEERYSQNQRRDFKLIIVNFIEDAQKLSDCARQSDPVAERFLLNLAFATISLIFLFFIAQGQISNTAQNLGVVGEEKQVLAAETQNAVQGFPVRLRIPSINVDAAVEFVGVSSSGVMDTPKNIVDVGWFNPGPRPGEKGSAVIAGHFNGIYGEDTVFTNLDKLKLGDKIFVEDDRGETISFVVRESRVYDPGYAEDVFSPNDGVYLNLITCDGVWDGSKKSFSKRLVVFSDKL